MVGLVRISRRRQALGCCFEGEFSGEPGLGDEAIQAARGNALTLRAVGQAQGTLVVEHRTAGLRNQNSFNTYRGTKYTQDVNRESIVWSRAFDWKNPAFFSLGTVPRSQIRARICKRLRSTVIDSPRLYSLVGQYDKLGYLWNPDKKDRQATDLTWRGGVPMERDH